VAGTHIRAVRHESLQTCRLLRFAPEARERVAALRADQCRFKELSESVEGLIQELASLAAFYAQFAEAYGQLGSELTRRRRGLQKVEQVNDDRQATAPREAQCSAGLGCAS
jgi:hypothetical protein